MNDFDNKQICSYKDIDRLGFTCDVCGRKVNGCRYINGMSFCEKCYQETFGKDNQQNEIQQLKQQLEEKGKEINIKNNKLCELKKQLQNCQNEIIRLKASNKNLMSVIWKTKRERANKGRQVCQSQNESIKYKKLLDKSEQNQKQLAIQELEKVKEQLDKEIMIMSNFDEMKKQLKYLVEILVYIQQRIKELKGEKDVED